MGDVKVDQLRAVVVVGAEGHRKANLPQGTGGAAFDARKRLAGSEPFRRYMEEAEGLHREHVVAGATFDEVFGNGDLTDGGRAEHREHTRAGGVDG